MTPDPAAIRRDQVGAFAVRPARHTSNSFTKLDVDSRTTAAEAPPYEHDQDGIDPATTAGRLMLNMLATLAEYERELITERVNAGIASARQSGTRFGRPPVDPAMVAEKLAVAVDARAKGRTAADAARLVGWSRATLYRHQAAADRSLAEDEEATP